jgi:hypothetical protein
MVEKVSLEEKEEKKPSLFARHEKEPTGTIADLSSQLINVSRRLRILEERYLNLRKKTQVSDQNMLSVQKNVSKELRATHDEMLEFRRDFMDLKDKVKLIVRELKTSAKSDELEIIKKYVNLWEPINFVTRGEVDTIVERAVKEKLEKTRK